VLERAAADDTLLHLPAGRYQMDGQWSREAFENFGLYGPEATIVPRRRTRAISSLSAVTVPHAVWSSTDCTST